MTDAGLHVMERESKSLRPRHQVARELQKIDLTAKEIAAEINWATGENVDYRTIQNAAAGIACSLDTYVAICRTYGWNFNERVMTPLMGADPLTALEKEIARERAELDAREAALARRRAADRARGSLADGGLRLVGEEDRPRASSLGFPD